MVGRALLFATIATGIGVLPSQNAWSQVIPGAADAARIRPEDKLLPRERSSSTPAVPPALSKEIVPPKGANRIRVFVKEIKIEGATAFSPEELEPFYAAYIYKATTLNKLYDIAAEITKFYRANGYFLSLAYVPNQSIKGGNGVIRIRVIEGHIAKVELSENVSQRGIIDEYISTLEAAKPLRVQLLESTLLRLNDVFGLSFRGVLSVFPEGGEGAVKLTLVPQSDNDQAQVTVDNYGSRFLGPHEVYASYTTSILPMHLTTIGLLNSVPTDELHYGTLSHQVSIAPNLTFGLSAGITATRPGADLELFDIKSKSTYASMSLAYQLIRQREENFAFKLSLDAQNTNSDILGTALTRDRVRAVRANALYDKGDRLDGSTMVDVTVSHGISAGASDKGDLNLSRAQARPDFAKAEISLSRMQDIGDDWSLLVTAAGQIASGPLYSSEEFGFGGQSFGRAYDASEITGDHGIAAALEIRYSEFMQGQPVGFMPYAFYDIGRVWNEDIAQTKRESGASAGLGVRTYFPQKIWGNLGFAYPLNRRVSTPFYGQRNSGPRILLSFSKEL